MRGIVVLMLCLYIYLAGDFNIVFMFFAKNLARSLSVPSAIVESSRCTRFRVRGDCRLARATSTNSFIGKYKLLETRIGSCQYEAKHVLW